MRNIAIFGRNIHDNFIQHLLQIMQKLQDSHIEIWLERNIIEFLKDKGDTVSFKGEFNETNLKTINPELLLCIGGDGTFLDAIAFIIGTEIPILGINNGRMGFLANISCANLEKNLEDIVNKNYKIQHRDLLTLEVNGQKIKDLNYALNEVSILKSEKSSLLTIKTYLGNDYLTDYWADGIVIATPTGSTAYSLSGGGPILCPQCKNIIITPISPHNLSIRPLVLPNNVEISIEVECRSDFFMLSTDSKIKKMPKDCKIKIFNAPFSVKTVKLNGSNFYKTLREKLRWGEDFRNKNNNF